jgi:outer membrane immunogenic protein
MTRLLSCAGALTLAVVAQTSFAADMRAPVAKAPAAVVAPSFIWTGPYAGLHCGYASGRSKSIGDDDAFDEDFATVGVADAGWTCGGQAGYNWQAGAWVYGIESDLAYLRLKGEEVVGSGNFFATSKFGWYGTLTGRIGTAWDRSFLYLKGGAVLGQTRNTAGDETPGSPDPTDVTVSDELKLGWALGVGYEQMLQPNWTWKIEYLYLGFDNKRSSNQDGDTYEHRNRVHTVKLGLNYRFATGK